MFRAQSGSLSLFHAVFERKSARKWTPEWFDLKNRDKNVSELGATNGEPRWNNEWRSVGKEVPDGSNR